MRTRGLVVDAALAVATFVVVAAAMAARVGEGRPPDVVAYLWAAGLGALLFLRRTGTALVATAVGIFGYYVAGWEGCSPRPPSTPRGAGGEKDGGARFAGAVDGPRASCRLWSVHNPALQGL